MLPTKHSGQGYFTDSGMELTNVLGCQHNAVASLALWVE